MKIADIAAAAGLSPADVVRVLQQIRTPSVEMLVAVLSAPSRDNADEYPLADAAIAQAGVPERSRPAASLAVADFVGDFRTAVDAVLATVTETPAGKPGPAGSLTGDQS